MAAFQWLFADAAAQSTCASTINTTQTTITLASSAAFPVPGASQQFAAIIIDTGNPSYSSSNPLATPYEYVYCTGNSANTLTVTRGQAGTSAQSFYAAATIAAIPLAEALTAAFGRVDTVNQTPNLGAGPIKIAETVLGASQASITFSAIPSGFRNLRVTVTARSDGTGVGDLILLPNADSTAADYNEQIVVLDAATAPSVSQNLGATAYFHIGALATSSVTANLFSAHEFYVHNYASASLFKTILAQGGYADSGGGHARDTTATWAAITAISSLKIQAFSGNLISGTVATLWGE